MCIVKIKPQGFLISTNPFVLVRDYIGKYSSVVAFVSFHIVSVFGLLWLKHDEIPLRKNGEIYL